MANDKKKSPLYLAIKSGVIQPYGLGNLRWNPDKVLEILETLDAVQSTDPFNPLGDGR